MAGRPRGFQLFSRAPVSGKRPAPPLVPGGSAMSDPQIGALRDKLTSRPRSTDYRQRRKDLDALGQSYALASDVTIEKVSANGVPAEWTSTPAATRDAPILSLHAGGYLIAPPHSH